MVNPDVNENAKASISIISVGLSCSFILEVFLMTSKLPSLNFYNVIILLSLLGYTAMMMHNYTHHRKLFTIKHLSDEYAKGLHSEDKIALLEKERSAFQLILQQEIKELCCHKKTRFMIFSINTNSEESATRLNLIQNALLELWTIQTYEEFIQLKTQLLRDPMLRGQSMMGFGNSDFYNKMLYS